MNSPLRKDLSISKWIYAISGPLLGIISFVVTFYLDPLNFGQNLPLSAIPALLFSIVVLAISQNISTSYELKKHTVYSDRIYEAVKDYLHVTKLGSPEKALSYINSRMPSLKEVRNTSFNILQSLERAEEKFYNSDVYTESTKLILINIAKNLIWKDIGDKYAIERCRDLYKSSSNLSNKKQNKYKYKLILNDEPQMNFIILEYSDGDREVLFNWDYRGVGQDPIVLLSRDKHIIDMFSIHYECLWMSASSDHDSSAIK